jgi:AraC family transcriptional activator of pobA
MRKDIPIHQLQDRASSGLEIRRFRRGDIPADVETMGAHRDDHYLFFLLEKGSALLMIDFQELALSETSLYYILPGQVHHRIRNEAAEGWFLAVDALLISPDFRHVFENQLALQQPFVLNEQHHQQCTALLCLIEEKYQESSQTPFHWPIIHALLQSFVGIAASGYSQFYPPRFQLSRPAQLSQQFKKLLVQQVRSLKSPSAYAAQLHVSEAYLNEALKKTTGFPVSYWIWQEVMLEAKRLLYYSQLNVKEIAYTLGYQDHTYFSRIFKKTVGITPLAFRANYHK